MDVGCVDIGFPEVGRKVHFRRETALSIGVAGVQRLDVLDFHIRRTLGVRFDGFGVVHFEIDFGLRAVIHRKGGRRHGRKVEFVELRTGRFRTVVRNALDAAAQQRQG